MPSGRRRKNLRNALSRFLVLPEVGGRKFWVRLGIFAGYLGCLGVWIWLGLPCWVQATFGIPCPGCGMSRALFALLRLDIPGALGWHFMVWSLPFLLWGLFTDGRVFRNARLNRLLWGLIGLGFLVQWILRLVNW